MEGGLAEAQAAFAMLDAQMSRESQTAAKIGDRLHVSSLHLSLAGCAVWPCHIHAARHVADIALASSAREQPLPCL